ncbi:MAG: MobA/MobL family protein, partial [Methylocella sp.]
MAIYHFSAKVIQRAAGRSAVAAAAYRAAARLFDERLGRTFNYSAKAGVIHSEILLPDGAPGRWLDRVILWNEVEAFERRKDAQLAREVELALPRELPPA